MKQGDTVFIGGNSSELWIKDYNTRVSTYATIEETPNKNAKKVLVMLNRIDGDLNVCCYVRRSKVKLLNN